MLGTKRGCLRAFGLFLRNSGVKPRGTFRELVRLDPLMALQFGSLFRRLPRRAAGSLMCSVKPEVDRILAALD